MAYKLSYTGPKIDEILEKSSSFDIDDEAWTIINGIDTLQMDQLMKPGNYVFNGNISLPDMDYLYDSSHQDATILERSALIFVKQMNQNIHQFISYASIDTKYITNIMIAWVKQADYSYIPYLYHHGDYSGNLFSITPNELADNYKHKFDKQLRLFSNTGYLQYYDLPADAYKNILTSVMSKDVYGNINDAFTTADSLINTTLNNTNFTEHVTDSATHITTSDKSTLDSKAYSDTVEAALENKKTQLKTSVETACTALSDILNSFKELISNQAVNLTNHSSDSVKHPSIEQINSWNNNAEVDHVHTVDEIQIDIDHVVFAPKYIGVVRVNTVLNGRTGPGTTYSKVCEFKNGAEVTITDESNGWYEVSGNSTTGIVNNVWVSSNYVSLTSNPETDLYKKAMQRHYTIASKDELLSLTSDDVQLHDWVFLNDASYPILYQIVDDTKLGTMDAFVQLVTDDFDDADLVWSAIGNKPTTINELGVTDPSNEYIDNRLSELNTVTEETANTIETIKNSMGLLDQKSYAHSMETLIDIIDNKMKIVNEILG